VLPSLKQTLERVDTLDPNAQDARRLMSIHLPGLIDRYANVPSAYRSELDGEGKSADEAATAIQAEFQAQHPNWPRANGLAAAARSAYNEN